MALDSRTRQPPGEAEGERCVVCDEVAAGAARCGYCGAATRAGEFEVRSLISQGAHGRVYRAVDPEGRLVALKELVFTAIPDLSVLDAFRREAEVLGRLSHPGIPRLVSSFESGAGVHTRLYLAQELVDGESLEALLARGVDAARAREIAERVLEILVYLQSARPPIFHRDVKPANLLVRADGSVALVDFGCARGAPGTLGATVDVGTWGYMPPEQLAGDVDLTTDVYALAATLVRLLTGCSPRELPGRRPLESPALPPDLRAWLARAMAPAPAQRFLDAADALRGLRAGVQPTIPLRRTSRQALLILMSVLVAATLAGGIVLASLPKPYVGVQRTDLDGHGRPHPHDPDGSGP